MSYATLRSAIAVALVVLCAAGCAQTREMRADIPTAFTWSDTHRHILMLPPDIVLSELTAGGLAEPRADWTKTAQGLVLDGIAGSLRDKGVEVTQFETLSNPHDVQLVKLNNAVGAEILLHGFGGAKLPTKGSALDWTLGPGTQDLRTRYNADYAMFVFVRDSYSTAGRRAVQLLAAMAGVAVQGGMQVAFISVVDLRTGNIVWFNTLVDQYGDLRDQKGTNNFIDAIMKGNPL
jgi:hypothetical protein